MRTRLALLVPLAIIAGCSSEPEPPPQPTPRPQARPIPRPPAPTPPPPAPRDWADMPLTPGSWTYSGSASTSSATFGSPGNPLFRLGCEGPTRAVTLQRFGAAAGSMMALRTSFGARNLPIASGPQFATATIAARDSFLDNMMFSRGRFSIEIAGLPMVMMPSWAEPARVVEDCRS